jgi:peroxiredoxin
VSIRFFSSIAASGDPIAFGSWPISSPTSRPSRQKTFDVVALSVDPLDKAKETVEKLQLTFPVAYGLEVPRDAEKVGAFWEERRKIIHATNFILDSDKKVVAASYSIGPIGRIVAVDALSHIQFFKRRKAQ